MRVRLQGNAATLAILALLACASAAGAAGPPTAGAPFDPAAWLADYAALKLELERRYSHLAWFGSPQGGVDLPALDSATRSALDRARSSANRSRGPT